MSNFVEQLKLAERAQEDVYFARIDRELIDALHEKAHIAAEGESTALQADSTGDEIATDENQQQTG